MRGSEGVSRLGQLFGSDSGTGHCKSITAQTAREVANKRVELTASPPLTR